MTESKKGHNFAIQGPTEKKIRVRLFFVLMLYIKFQVPSSSGSLVLQPTKGVTDRRTDGQTVRRTNGQAQTNMPPQLLLSWGHNKDVLWFFIKLVLQKSRKLMTMFVVPLLQDTTSYRKKQ